AGAPARRVRRAAGCSGAWGVSAGAGWDGATDAPLPGWEITRPWAASRARARETVIGLTPCRRMISRLDGSRSPGRDRFTSSRRIAASRAILLSFCMRNQDSVIVRGAIAAPPDRRSAWRGTLLAGLGVAAFSGTLPATAFALQGFDPYLVAA